MSLPPQAKPFEPLAREAAQRHAIPASLILAVCGQESGFRPTAYRPEPQIKDASYGLMQLLGKTARGLGYLDDVGCAKELSGLFDPETNINLGAKLLAENFAHAGSLAGAVSAYNGGWRPAMGFGRPAPHALRICLAWNPKKEGECLTWREVAAGSYANSTYVQAVLTRMTAYDT